MNTVARAGRASLPSVDRLLASAQGRSLTQRYGRTLTTEGARVVLARHRQRLAAMPPHARAPEEAVLIRDLATHIEEITGSSLKAVFNLTGTVLHTNLGRALYPQAAVAAATVAMKRPVNLEYDLDGAARGERDAHVEGWLTRLTGAEAAIVVNNNAAAVYLVLNALAAGREVLVSRGELVEIGGSFRIPDIMSSAGCRLREVGTTNRTHPRDFESAIGEATAALMKVHTSNYRIEGFTCAVDEAELARIAHQHQLPLVNDLGSGTLVDLDAWGLPHEPTATEALSLGADLVTFSGDKLLGGPQCGMIVGRKDLVDRIRRHPMKRALRLDKVRLAALEAVLRLYADPDRLAQELPTLRLLTRPQADIRLQAERVRHAFARVLADRAAVQVVDCESQIGSGALPIQRVASAAVSLTLARAACGGGAVERLAGWLRSLPVPVIGRIHEGALLLDMRCLEDENEFVAQLEAIPLGEGWP